MNTTRLMMMVATGATLLSHTTPAQAQYNFCFGPTIQRSVPNPAFDGEVENDNGWLNAFTYRGENGTPDANIIVWGNSFSTTSPDHKWIALGVKALNDTQFDKADSVVVLYKIKNPNANQANYGQIVVSPLTDDNAIPPSGNRPGTSTYLTSPDGVTWTQVGDAPSWVTWGSTATTGGGACTAAQPSTSCSWTVELGIDTAAAGAPSSIELFYVDVVELTNRTPAQSRQFSWPPGNTLVDTTDHTLTPATSTWGNASVGSTTLCKGVSFSYSDISSSPHGGGNLKAGVPETFTVKLHNSGSDAKGVIAHFAHAPFGLCGLTEACFIDLGSTNVTTSCGNGGAAGNCCSGTAGCVPPDPSTAGTAMQKTWNPTDSTNDLGHQCIRVKLEATVGDTTFVNQGDFRNMHVDHSSTVTAQARINMKQVPPPEGGGNQRIRLASHATTQFALGDGSVPSIPIGTLTAQIAQQYQGYRYTGKHVTVANVRSEVWEPVGSYGFQLQHPMTLEFQNSFVERHPAIFREQGKTHGDTSSEPSALRDPEVIIAINRLLATDAERPPVTDWNFQVDKVKVVPNTNGAVSEIEVPVDGEVMLATTATYGPGGAPNPGGCCPGSSSSKTTPSKVGTLGLVVLVGAVVCRRRRRR